MWCVLGTLGSFLNGASFADASLFFRLLLSPVALPSARADDEAGTDWSAPAEMSLEPLSDFEGLDDEKRRWWPRMKTGEEAAALDAEDAMDEASPAGWPDEATTRRTEDGNMVVCMPRCNLSRRRRSRLW